MSHMHAGGMNQKQNESEKRVSEEEMWGNNCLRAARDAERRTQTHELHKADRGRRAM